MRDDAEGIVESPGKLLAFGRGVGAERVDGLSEEEFSCRVESLSDERSTKFFKTKQKGDWNVEAYHTKEIILDVDWGPIGGKIAYHMHNMMLH